MPDLAELVAACRAAPDDDAPRLVWADAIGGERGELVVLQCDLARGDLAPAEVARRRRRCDELLAANGAAWADLGSFAKRVVFRRGFVASAEISMMTYLREWRAIHARAPLLASLHAIDLDATEDYSDYHRPEFSGVDGIALVRELLELLASAGAPQLAGLALDDTYVAHITGDTEWHYNWISFADELLEVIAPSPQLGHLRAFAIGQGGDGITERGLRALIAARPLAHVARFVLRCTREVPPALLGELFATMPELRALAVPWWMPQAQLAPHLPASLVELAVAHVDDVELPALANAPCAPTLERLAISGGELAHADHFAAFRRLRALDLGARSRPDEIAPAGIRALAAAGLPHLRELRITSRLAPESALVLAAELGPQLERLDCGAAEYSPAVVDELVARVAGEVITGPYRAVDLPLVAGVNAREPWQHYGLVEIPRERARS